MLYRPYGKNGFEVSAFGVGCMRLPRIFKEGCSKTEVDREKAYELIRYAANHGVNYFDTAYGYHHTTSEEVLGEALEGELRKKVKIATKQPLMVMKTQADIRRNLENTLKKLRTDYIDVYLLHNIQSGWWNEIKERGIIDEFVRFKEEGLIRSVGFSYHGQYPTFQEVMEYFPWDMCQVQQNLLDADKEVTEKSILLAEKLGTALVVMEPLRGGGLATPPDRIQAIYDEYPKKRSAAEWAFRHLLNYQGVSTILSGVTTMEQLKENIAIFSQADTTPGCLTPEEKTIIARVKAAYEAIVTIPCTACEYCLPCPSGVNIPAVFGDYNNGMSLESFDQFRRSYYFKCNSKIDASQCVECGACLDKCPQHIQIIDQLKVAHKALHGWIE